MHNAVLSVITVLIIGELLVYTNALDIAEELITCENGHCEKDSEQTRLQDETAKVTIHVQTLTTETFRQYLARHDYTLVLYYVHWDIRCEKIHDEFFLAGTLLAIEKGLTSPRLGFGMVDCDAQPALKQEQGIPFFPYVVLYQRPPEGAEGRQWDYHNWREAEPLAEFVERLIQPAVAAVHSAEELSALLQTTLANEELLFVAAIESLGLSYSSSSSSSPSSSSSSSSYAAYLAAADEWRLTYRFVATDNAALFTEWLSQYRRDPSADSAVADTETRPPRLVVVNTILGSYVDYPALIDKGEASPWTRESLSRFIERIHPLVIEFDPDRMQPAVDTGRPFVVIFTEMYAREVFVEATLRLLRPLARRCHRLVTVAYADWRHHYPFVALLGLRSTNSGGPPDVAFIDFSRRRHYVFPESAGEVSVESVMRFIDDCMAQRLAPAVRGGLSPATAAPQSASVTPLTPALFREYVDGGHVDMVVAFTWPWCAQCMALSPTWHALAVLLSSANPPTVVATFDVAAYDVPESYRFPHVVETVPDIWLFPSNTSNGQWAVPQPFHGVPTLQNLVAFVKSGCREKDLDYTAWVDQVRQGARLTRRKLIDDPLFQLLDK